MAHDNNNKKTKHQTNRYINIASNVTTTHHT